ncbi:isocitrate lyase/PEP mutase family protein [Thalassotalea sp. HSM 43]|uniref:isocitrate lyase/PEP mutase family protein n=1 Tax=Thalassotalea sp. HSM 43 TaxID=2552945 RepID=UPI001E51E450|nr:isocitrate lyase/phosphoenolpyruvate mutase family protein [Thalassotalea sp. HSM 43]
MATLKQRLQQPGVIKAPGVFDGLSCRLVKNAGFDVGFVSGAGIAFSRFGVADIGLVTIKEVTDTISAIREYNDLPLIVDIDTGFGNAINTQRTVKMLETAGANAMQMEDQVMPKRCGHMQGKDVVATSEMVGKIKAFVDARASDDTLLVARTDALAVNGFDDAMHRAAQYIDAGADILFVEAPQSYEQMQIIGQEFGDKVPLVHNLVEGGNSPIDNADMMQSLNYKIALYPIALLNGFIPKAEHVLSHIQQTGDTQSYQQPLWDLQQINDLLGAGDMLAQAEKYK